jgi:hypothetical protein
MPRWPCHSECPKHTGDKLHSSDWKAKCHTFYPIILSAAIQATADLLPDYDQSDLPQPWVHPIFKCAYAIKMGGCVLLAPPRKQPTSADGTIRMCAAAWNGRGVTTNWLKYQSPQARKACQDRKRCEAAELPYEIPVSLVSNSQLKDLSSPGLKNQFSNAIMVHTSGLI